MHESSKDTDAALAALADKMGRSATLGENQTVGDFWPRFLRRCEVKGLTNATIQNYARYWRNDIEPAFGAMTWDRIRYGVV